MPKEFPMTVTVTDVDLTDLDVFERNEAWARFATLRREAPVHWNPEPSPNSGFWSITRHEDIVAFDRDSETFTSTGFVNLEEIDDDLIDIRRSMLESDGTRHRAAVGVDVIARKGSACCGPARSGLAAVRRQPRACDYAD
jgi:cytochrome P450